MAKVGHGRPVKRNKIPKKESKNETRNLQRAKDRERQARKSRSLTRQIRNVRWDEDEFSEEVEELDDIE